MLAISWSNPTIPPLLTFSLSMLCTLCVLAFPPRNRYLAFLLYFLPATHAFIHQLHITPWYSINDTLGRLLYIEAAYLSNVLLIEGWDPHASESGSESEGWKERFWTAGKVFYMRCTIVRRRARNATTTLGRVHRNPRAFLSVSGTSSKPHSVSSLATSSKNSSGLPI